eukprot:364927-Chlamydomonas_euryale.AAC.11
MQPLPAERRNVRTEALTHERAHVCQGQGKATWPPAGAHTRLRRPLRARCLAHTHLHQCVRLCLQAPPAWAAGKSKTRRAQKEGAWEPTYMDGDMDEAAVTAGQTGLHGVQRVGAHLPAHRGMQAHGPPFFVAASSASCHAHLQQLQRHVRSGRRHPCQLIRCQDVAPRCNSHDIHTAVHTTLGATAVGKRVFQQSIQRGQQRSQRGAAAAVALRAPAVIAVRAIAVPIRADVWRALPTLHHATQARRDNCRLRASRMQSRLHGCRQRIADARQAQSAGRAALQARPGCQSTRCARSTFTHGGRQCGTRERYQGAGSACMQRGARCRVRGTAAASTHAAAAATRLLARLAHHLAPAAQGRPQLRDPRRLCHHTYLHIHVTRRIGREGAARTAAP